MKTGYVQLPPEHGRPRVAGGGLQAVGLSVADRDDLRSRGSLIPGSPTRRVRRRRAGAREPSTGSGTGSREQVIERIERVAPRPRPRSRAIVAIPHAGSVPSVCIAPPQRYRVGDYVLAEQGSGRPVVRVPLSSGALPSGRHGRAGSVSRVTRCASRLADKPVDRRELRWIREPIAKEHGERRAR